MQGDVCAVLPCPGKLEGENQGYGDLSSDLQTLIQVTWALYKFSTETLMYCLGLTAFFLLQRLSYRLLLSRRKLRPTCLPSAF